MGKIKSHLRKYVRRRTAVGTFTQPKPPKRRLERTPRKAACIRSPFKSPLHKASPVCKKAKTSRRLFEINKTKNFWGSNDSGQSALQEKIKTSENSDKVQLQCKEVVNTGNVPNSVDDYEELSDSTESTEEISGLEYLESDIQFQLQTKTCNVTEDPTAFVSNSADLHKPVTTETKTSAKNTEYTDTTKKMIELIPSVMKNLSEKDGLDIVMLEFFEMVSENKFPLHNISFLLWSEVVKWFSCSSTTRMRYSDDTKLFWKLGWRLFGTRFVHFMGGFKRHGDIILKVTHKGNYSPASSEINFAVPDVNILREFNPYDIGGDRKPGIFEDTITFLCENLKNISACLTFDGKKIKQGLTCDSGDVDLLGFEKGTPLRDKQHHLDTELASIDHMVDILTERQGLPDEGLCNEADKLGAWDRKELKTFLLKYLSEISMSVNEVETIKTRKEYCKTKLIERGGDADWRKGRYVYAISAIIAFLHDIDEYVKKAYNVIDNICQHVSFLGNANYIDANKVNLGDDERYIPVEQQIGDKNNTRLLKQKSDTWFALRSTAKVTGSTLYTAVGCEGIGKQKEHFEKIMCKVAGKEPSASQKVAMEHGTQNEINAVATMVGKIMPVLEPSLIFCEEGCVTVAKEDGATFMVVSPDGSLRRTNELCTTEVAVEIKCPMKAAHSSFPDRYLLQCLSEIEILDARYLLYISWHNEVTTVFRVNRNQDLFRKAMKIALNVYGTENPKKPTKLTDDIKELKNDIAFEAKCKVQMLGRFPSCVATEDHVTTFKMKAKSSESFIDLLGGIRDCLRTSYELQREKATEAVVFIIADLNRSSSKTSFRCSPVAWFPKGYSLDSDTMRKIAEEVHTKCTESGIHVPCEAFDGQWHTLVVRSVEGKPLTVLQLQKDLWQEVEKMNKKEIISELKKINRSPQWTMAAIITNDICRKCIAATNGGLKLPQYILVKDMVNEKCNDNDDDIEHGTNLANVVPTTVQDASDISEDVLAMSSVTETIELEAFASNINDEEWSQELDKCQHTEIGTVLDGTDLFEETRKQTVTQETQIILDFNDMECLLALFKTTKDCNKKHKWNEVSVSDLLKRFVSKDSLNTFLDIELRAIVRYLKQTKSLKLINESANKTAKVEGLVAFLKLDQCNEQSPSVRKIKRSSFGIKTLKDMASKVVGKYSKHQLSCIMAEYLWERKFETWNNDVEAISLNGDSRAWFYKSEYNERRKQYEVKCIDSTHLLTRMRRKSCKGGLDGISNEGWLKVAKGKKTLLTPIMVDEITDPMSSSMATTHFSEAVEHEMRKNDDVASADLCRDIRSWWESEDNPGIPSITRVLMREPLRKRLLSKVDFSRFPPPTQYVAGWPIQLWEALLASIDAKAYLYSLAHGGTYNVRAFSGLIGETFFSELTLNDKRGHGTVTAKEFGEYVGYTTEQLQIRLDQDRKFAYCTSKEKVYPVVDESYNCSAVHNDMCRVCKNGCDVLPNCILTRDHVFDSSTRIRLPGRMKLATVSTDRNATLNGTLGVRWEKARRNDAKMLTTKRMGLE